MAEPLNKQEGDEMEGTGKTGKSGRWFFSRKKRDGDGRSQPSNVMTIEGDVTNQSTELKTHMKTLLNALKAAEKGDFSVRMAVPEDGMMVEIAGAFNGLLELNESMANEVIRVSKIVGEEGRITERASLGKVTGMWASKIDSLNALISNLAQSTGEISRVVTAVAEGDLFQKVQLEFEGVPIKGEFLRIATTTNTMVDKLNSFASEVTRVAREVGSEGKLGGQAKVPGVAGTWKDLTDRVNDMAANLTNQVRNIAEVATAIAQGDLSSKITVEAMGEILELKNTINGMVDNLGAVIGDINGVMTMVGEGNLTRLVEAEAAGEFASMADGINGTIESLRGIVTELTEAGTNIGAISQNLLSAGQEMNAMITQFSSSVGQIADGARTQAQQISEASRESEGVGETASDTAARAENMRQMSEAANKATVEGSEAMEETMKNTTLMLEGSKESVERINSLSKSTEQIQEVIDIIRDIATQTNILAINAAIEAVRAGKQGRGFAVVAEEVKTLSADSKNQAKNISDLVQSILKETEGTVTTINTMAENVEMGKRSIEQTSGALSEINRSVGETTKEAQEISVAAGQQKGSIDTVSQSLDKISGIAADTSTSGAQLVESTKALSSSMQELAATSQTLAEMSERFRQTVERFTIEETVSARPRAVVGSSRVKSIAKSATKKKTVPLNRTRP